MTSSSLNLFRGEDQDLNTRTNMICILLVAGHAQNLEQEIKNDATGLYTRLEGVPKVH